MENQLILDPNFTPNLNNNESRGPKFTQNLNNKQKNFKSLDVYALCWQV
jgi:hypothetical protein